MQQQWTISWWIVTWWKMDFIQQLMTSSVVGLRKSSKAFPKVKSVPKIGHGHCLVVCCPSDPLQLSEFWQNKYIWEVCSANTMRCTKTAMVNIKGPILLHNNGQLHDTQLTIQKLNEILPHLPYSPDLLPTDYHFFNFLQGKCFHNWQKAENAFQEFVES